MVAKKKEPSMQRMSTRDQPKSQHYVKDFQEALRDTPTEIAVVIHLDTVIAAKAEGAVRVDRFQVVFPAIVPAAKIQELVMKAVVAATENQALTNRTSYQRNPTKNPSQPIGQ
jgi:hypothetical protein